MSGQQKVVVALDMDGTLILTEHLNRLAAEEAAGVAYIDWPTWAGKPEPEVHAWLTETYPDFSMSVEDYMSNCASGRDARWNEIKARPGIAAVLQMFRDRGADLITVTSTDHETAVRKLRHAGLSEYFSTIGTFADGVFGGDDVIGLGLRKKPAPDSYMHVAKKLGAGHLVVFEDSNVGLTSAHVAQQRLGECSVETTIGHFYALDGEPGLGATFHISDDRADLEWKAELIITRVFGPASTPEGWGQSRAGRRPVGNLALP